MHFLKKLKPDRDITGVLPGVLSVLIFLIAVLLFGIEKGLAVITGLAFLWFIFAAIAYFRTKNISYFIVAIYGLCMMFYFALVPKGPYGLQTKQTATAFIVMAVFLMISLIYLAATKRFKWRGREIFELAAKPVKSTENGFTYRPFPAGRLEYSEDELLGFAKFAAKNLIAMPYIESDRIVFAIVKMGKEFGYLFLPENDYKSKTWAAFDKDGNISVQISKEDYLDYKEDLTFDELCVSLGNVFKEFFELYRKGEEVRIIDKMNEMKIAVLS